VLPFFRRKGISVAWQNAFRAGPDFGLVVRLRNSDVPLARRLFPDFETFAICLGGETTSLLRRTWARVLKVRIFNRLKVFVAIKFIMRSRLLLQVCQKLGKFQGIDGPHDRLPRRLPPDTAE
jgi:hypothetical protein